MWTASNVDQVLNFLNIDISQTCQMLTLPLLLCLSGPASVFIIQPFRNESRVTLSTKTTSKFQGQIFKQNLVGSYIENDYHFKIFSLNITNIKKYIMFRYKQFHFNLTLFK